MIKFNSILKEELADFLALRKASKCKSIYDHDKTLLRRFDEYLCDISCKKKNLTEKQITGFINTLSGGTRTIAAKVIVIRIFLNQLKSYGFYSYIPPIPKVHNDYIPYIFSEVELGRIFNCVYNLEKGCKVQKNTLIHVEQPMILRLMYGCGLRMGETLELKMENVNLVSGVLTLKKTKGNKQRIVPMHQTLIEILEKYCMAMGIIGYSDKYLFPTINILESVTPKNAMHKFNDILKQSEISLPYREKYQRGPCLHCLRHVFVFKSFSNLEKNGQKIDDMIPYLSIYLGHESLRETEKYLKFSSELFPDEMKLFEKYTTQVFPEVNYDE
ncbi:MAG: tyrosine-type recombinase/integrase [Sphaerochaetaceae bacterium]|nr:tyrosine-type recombinase/integrase [Sphaerochaetaceae bacterium]